MSPPDIAKPSKHRSKSNLPQKICVACARPFSWRKKWQRDWEHVRYCSERCRRGKVQSDGASSA